MLKMEVGTIKIHIFRQELLLYPIKNELKFVFCVLKLFSFNEMCGGG
jgi:hypothetical protein